MYSRSPERPRKVSNPHVVPEQSSVRAVLRSPGECLDPTMRHTMQALMGHDFSQVKVHTGPHAAESARAVGATAFTVGQHIVFGSGAYAPSTDQGRELLRHELMHTIQQPAIARVPDLQLTDPGDRFEAEADRAARGQSAGRAQVQSAALPMLARQPASGAPRPSAASYRGISITIGGSPGR